MSQETTAVETMSYERLADAVDEQKAVADVEAGFEKEKSDVPKASEQNVSEKDDVIFSNKDVDDEFKDNLLDCPRISYPFCTKTFAKNAALESIKECSRN